MYLYVYTYIYIYYSYFFAVDHQTVMAPNTRYILVLNQPHSTTAVHAVPPFRSAGPGVLRWPNGETLRQLGHGRWGRGCEKNMGQVCVYYITCVYIYISYDIYITATLHISNTYMYY